MIQGSWNDFPQFIPLYLFRQNCGINKIIRYLKCVVLWFMYILWRDYPHWANFSVTVMRHLYIHCKPSRQYYDYLIFIYIYSYTYLFLIILPLWDYFPSVCPLLFHFFFLFLFMSLTVLGTNSISIDLSEKLYFILVWEEFSLEIRFPSNTWEAILLSSGFVL